MLDGLTKNRETLEQDINSITFYMNGGLDYNDAWLLTPEQRRAIFKTIERHYDMMNPNKKSMM